MQAAARDYDVRQRAAVAAVSDHGGVGDLAESLDDMGADQRNGGIGRRVRGVSDDDSVDDIETRSFVLHVAPSCATGRSTWFRSQ